MTRLELLLLLAVGAMSLGILGHCILGTCFDLRPPPPEEDPEEPTKEEIDLKQCETINGLDPWGYGQSRLITRDEMMRIRDCWNKRRAAKLEQEAIDAAADGDPQTGLQCTSDYPVLWNGVCYGACPEGSTASWENPAFCTRPSQLGGGIVLSYRPNKPALTS